MAHDDTPDLRAFEEILVNRLLHFIKPTNNPDPKQDATILSALALHRLANAMEDVEEDLEEAKPKVNIPKRR